MPKLVFVAAVILNLALYSPCSASQAILGAQPVQANKSAKTVQGHSTVPSVERNVVNIFVDKIEGGAIYSTDGRKFEITGSTKVIDNSHPATKMPAAELSFENGDLVSVVLK